MPGSNQFSTDPIIIDDFSLAATRQAENPVSVKDNDKNQTINRDNHTEIPTIATYPKYSVSNYISDRNNWKKQLDPLVGKGFFYFKIFFNFDTNYGLLGNVLKGESAFGSGNTAVEYLNYCNGLTMYKSESIANRLDALKKFVTLLGDISERTPWFFKEVSGLSNVKASLLEGEDFKENSISISCGEESTDARLGTLFDLYKYCCYDNIRNKEIIPANLRKFEMKIMFFHIPLRNYHTEINTKIAGKEIKIGEKNTNFNYEQVDSNLKDANKKDNEIMSFKMFTFQNCEFDVNSMNEFNDNISNENSFELGKNQIKINYDRVYENRYNEFKKLLISQDIYFENNSDAIDARLSNIANIINDNIKKSPDHNIYNSGNLFGDGESHYYKGVNKTKPLFREQLEGGGEIYSQYYLDKIAEIKGGLLVNQTIRKTYSNGNLYSNQTNVLGKYFLDKLKYLFNGTIIGGNLYNYNFGVGSSYLSNKITRWRSGEITGNLYDYNFGVGSKYLINKLSELKNGNNISGNIFDYNFGRVGTGNQRSNSEYLSAKLKKLIKGDISGNIFDYKFGVGTKYLMTKLDQIKNGNNISGNIYDYRFGAGSGYLNTKLNQLRNGHTISGNIYDYKFGTGSAYLVNKLNKLVKSDISGNIYDYKFGVGSKYLMNKLNQIKNSGVISGNIYDYKFGVGSAYLLNKLNKLVNGSIGGNIYDYDLGGESIYFAEKISKLKNGNSIGGNIYDYNTGGGSKYLEDKINRIKKGDITGNLYDYNLGVGSKYLIDKLNQIKAGEVSGNLYDYNLGLGSFYLNEKLNQIKKGDVSGNLYDYKLGTGSKYLSDKLSQIKKSGLRGNLYGYNLGEGSRYFDEKLNRLDHTNKKENNSQLRDLIELLGEKNQFNESSVFKPLSFSDVDQNQFNEKGSINSLSFNDADKNEFKETNKIEGLLFDDSDRNEFNESGKINGIELNSVDKNPFDEMANLGIYDSETPWKFSVSLNDADKNEFNENYVSELYSVDDADKFEFNENYASNILSADDADKFEFNENYVSTLLSLDDADLFPFEESANLGLYDEDIPWKFNISLNDADKFPFEESANLGLYDKDVAWKFSINRDDADKFPFEESANLGLYTEDIPWKFNIKLNDSDKNPFNEDNNLGLYDSEVPWKFSIAREEEDKNEFNEKNTITSLRLSEKDKNEFKLSWEAQAIRNSNNIWATSGNPSSASTWLGKLSEATWSRTKSAIGF